MEHKKSILVVEDEKTLRELYMETLQAEGYDVTSAEDGVEGVEKFGQGTYDLILLDLKMPRMDGWATLESVRSVSDCPVIIVTGMGTAEHIIRGLLEAGADDYLVKPFGIRELLARMTAVLRRSVATP